MKLFARNVLAIVIGIVLGSLVNGAIIDVSGKIIPPPNGADLTTLEGLKTTMHLFTPKHYLLPFLAHALGTFIAAYLACRIAKSSKMIVAAVVGVVFLIGGIWMITLVPSPIWFTLTDLIFAYLPMAYLAKKIAR